MSAIKHVFGLNPPAPETVRRRYGLAQQADLAVFYAADSARYASTQAHPILKVVTLEAFTRFYANCPSLGFTCNGLAIGGVIFDGRQAHIAVLPSHHGNWGFLLRPACDWLFSLQPEIVVEVENDNLVTIAFMERNGWQRVPGEAATAADGGQRSVTFLMTQQHIGRRAARR